MDTENENWKTAALKCGLYLAVTDVSTPEKYITAQSRAACALMDKAELAAETLDALKTLWAFIEDLGKSNPGFLGKLVLQDYAQMNEAYLKTERVLQKHDQGK